MTKANTKAQFRSGACANPNSLLSRESLAWVATIANSIQRAYAVPVPTQDLIQYGMIGLLEASRRYDPSFGVSFRTFSYTRIHGAIYDALRSPGVSLMNRRTYQNAKRQDQHPVILQPVLPTTLTANLAEQLDANLDKQRLTAKLQAALEGLSHVSKSIILQHYYLHASLSDIAISMGTSKSWLSRLHAKALDELKDALQNTKTITTASA